MRTNLRHRLWIALATCMASASAFAQSAKLPAKNIALTVSNGTAGFHGVGLGGPSGSPALPKYTLSFLLPPGTDPKTVSVQIDGAKEEILPGSYDVAPVPAMVAQNRVQWPAGARISNGRDLNVYGKDALYPASHLGMVRFGSMGPYQLVQVDIHDYQYNPSSGQLRRLVDGTVSVRVASSGKAAVLSTASTNSPAVRKLPDQFKDLVVNFDQAIGAYSALRTGAVQSLSPAASTTYAILTTEAIRQGSTQLGAFADAKTRAGFQVQLVTAGTVYLRSTSGTWICEDRGCTGGWGGGKGDAAAESLRAWLTNNYAGRNIEYALLVGNPDPDTGSVPMKMMWPRLQESTDREAPTDYYYAELTGDWDLNDDGFSGQEGVDDGIGGMDKFCEIAVGRIPFYGNFQDLDKILAKTVRYMQESDISWRSSVLFSMRQMFIPFNNHYLGEHLRTTLLDPKGWRTLRVYDSAFGVGPDRTPTTETNVVDLWKNNAVGYHLWQTHGFSEGAADVFTSASAPLLDDLHPSFTFQLSCLTSYPEIPKNVSYSLLKNGGIATVGATRVSWLWTDEQVFEGDNGSYGNIGNKFSRYLIEDSLSVGKALSKLRANTAGWWMNMQVFNIYGDPSLVLGEAPIAPPSPPTGLAAEAADGKAILTWNPAPRASTYTVRRSASAAGPFTTVATDLRDSRYEDGPLDNGTTYFYDVSSANPAGTSTVSNSVQVRPTGITSGLRLQYRVGDASATDNQIKPQFMVVNTGNKTEALAGAKIRYWISNDNSSAIQAVCDWAQIGAANVSLEVLTPSSPTAGADRILELTFLPTAPALAPGASTGDIQLRMNHTDWTNFTETGDYSYDPDAKSYAFADKSCLYSPVGQRVSGIEPSLASPPPVPSGLAAVAGNAKVELKWNATSSATGYEVFRRTATGIAASVGTTPDTTFADLTASNGTTYWYSVVSRNASGTSARSTEVSATPAGAPASPAIVSLVAGDGKATVTWTEVSNASFYTIKSTAKPGDTTALSVTSPASSLQFYGLANGTPYTFVVSASNSYGQSANSAPVVVTPNGVVAPATPVGLKAVAGDAKVTLTWNAVATATSYLVERADATHPFADLATVTSPTHVDATAINGTKYLYRVRARNAGGSSAPSTTVEATPTRVTEPCSPASDMTGGNSGNFNTPGAVCKRTSSNIAGWGCSNFAGRTVKVNGVTVTCGAALPAKTSTGYYYFDIGAGSYSWASLYWW